MKEMIYILGILIYSCSLTNCRPGNPNDNFKPYATTGTRNDGYHNWHYAKAGALRVNEDVFQVNFLEGKVEGNGRGFTDLSGSPFAGKAEVSLLTSRFGSDKHNLDAKFVTASVEAGGGAMARAALFDHTIHTGPVDINYGIVADTGIYVDKGLEVKVLGVGGYVKATGIQACFVVCFGINWG